MADLKYYDIILKPVITEKSMNEMADKKYVFYVHPQANKVQIKEAVQKMFDGAVVERVNTMNLDGKKKRTRSYKYGRTAKRKKAIVTLTPDSKEIEIFQGM
jgi:large subunit ribosomal protein L23